MKWIAVLLTAVVLIVIIVAILFTSEVIPLTVTTIDAPPLPPGYKLIDADTSTFMRMFKCPSTSLDDCLLREYSEVRGQHDTYKWGCDRYIHRRIGTSCSYDYCELYEYIGVTIPSPPSPLDFLTNAFNGFIGFIQSLFGL